MIRFTGTTTLYVVEEYDEVNDRVLRDKDVIFEAGEVVDADVVEDFAGFVTLQFGDGSVANGVHRDWFTEVGNPLAYTSKMDKLPLP